MPELTKKVDKLCLMEKSDDSDTDVDATTSLSEAIQCSSHVARFKKRVGIRT